MTLASSLIAFLPAAQAQGKMGWISVEGYTSTRYKLDLKNERHGNENTRFWNFYYAFTYDLRDLSGKACFTGNPELAIADLDDILNDGAREDAEEVPSMQMAEYLPGKDRIRMEIRNRRPENKSDEGRYVPVEIVRCGVRPPAKEAGLEDLTGTDTKSFLGYLWQGVFDNRTRVVLKRELTPLGRTASHSEVGFMNDPCMVVQGDRDHSVTEFKAGERLILINTGKTRQSGNLWMLLGPEGYRFGDRSLMVMCDVPSTSTLDDLERALDGLIQIER